MPTNTTLDVSTLEGLTREAREQRIADGSFCEYRPFDQQDAGRYNLTGRPYGPERFTWGAVQAVHRLGPYAIVEYLRNVTGPYDPMELKDRAISDERSFSIFVDGHNCSHSYRSLDRALLACVAWRADARLGGFNRAANSRAATYMARLIELEDEDG